MKFSRLIVVAFAMLSSPLVPGETELLSVTTANIIET
jgi:hypothetical protein